MEAAGILARWAEPQPGAKAGWEASEARLLY
jgi:hypothetical protein